MIIRNSALVLFSLFLPLLTMMNESWGRWDASEFGSSKRTDEKTAGRVSHKVVLADDSAYGSGT